MPDRASSVTVAVAASATAGAGTADVAVSEISELGLVGPAQAGPQGVRVTIRTPKMGAAAACSTETERDRGV